MITTVGIEYTYMTRRNYDRSYSYSKYINAFKRKGFEAHDDNCLEIPSPIHKSYNSLKTYFDKLHKLARRFNLVTHKRNEQSGGGQIHLGLQELPKVTKFKFINNILRDVTNRPYLSWIFNDWCDEWNSVSLACSTQFINKLLSGELYWSDHEYLFFKDFAIAYRKNFNTLEFRIFDSKKNWGEVKDHVDFALAYYEYILKRTKHREFIRLRVINMEQVKSFTYSQCVDEFYYLLDELKLSRRRYNKYIKRNLKERFKNGALT